MRSKVRVFTPALLMCLSHNRLHQRAVSFVRTGCDSDWAPKTLHRIVATSLTTISTPLSYASTLVRSPSAALTLHYSGVR